MSIKLTTENLKCYKEIKKELKNKPKQYDERRCPSNSIRRIGNRGR